VLPVLVHLQMSAACRQGLLVQLGTQTGPPTAPTAWLAPPAQHHAAKGERCMHVITDCM
jgi:hypothetical protein